MYKWSFFVVAGISVQFSRIIQYVTFLQWEYWDENGILMNLFFYRCAGIGAASDDNNINDIFRFGWIRNDQFKYLNTVLINRLLLCGFHFLKNI